MRILLTNFHPYNGGGHTSYLLNLFKELSKDNAVFLACPKTSRLNNFARKIESAGVIDLDFPGKIKEIPHIVKNLKILITLIKNEKIDLIHANGSPDHKMAIYAKLLLKNKISLVRTKHDSIPPKTNPAAKIPFTLGTDHIILVSNYQKQIMLNSGYSNDKLSVIQAGIDTNFFSPKPKNQELLNTFGIRQEDLVFVSTAGTAVHKGWQFLVEAISKMSEDLKNSIKIILAGDKPSKEIINTYVDKFNMTGQVFFTGLLPDVRNIVSIGDVGFVLSYKIECISLACREMMSMGKPVLISDYAGLPENIDDNINGWITKTGDVNEIYQKIQEIVQNREKLDSTSLSAREKAINTFGLTPFINKTYQCYHSVHKTN